MSISATLTDAGKNLLRDSAAYGYSCRITYVAVGTDSTAPSSSDTALGAEAFRKIVTIANPGASAGEMLIVFYLAPRDALGVAIEEIGFFAGDDASSTPGSGVLMARALYSHTHDSGGNESIQLTCHLQF